VQKGKELNDFQRNPLDIEILSNLRFGSLDFRDTSVTRVTNKVKQRGLGPKLQVLDNPRRVLFCNRVEYRREKN
jgi:hypothetical protein